MTTTFAPAPRERQRVLAADPAPGAGDDRDLALEVWHVVFLPQVVRPVTREHAVDVPGRALALDVAILLLHPLLPQLAHVVAAAFEPSGQSELRGVSTQIEYARYGRNASREAVTPSTTTNAAGSITIGARSGTPQLDGVKRTGFPAAIGSSTCFRSFGHQSTGSSQLAKSSVWTTGAPSSAARRPARVVLPAPPRPSTATIRVATPVGGEDARTSSTSCVNASAIAP